MNKSKISLLMSSLFLIMFVLFLIGNVVYEIKNAIATDKKNTFINLVTCRDNETDVNNNTVILPKSFISMSIGKNESDCKSLINSTDKDNTHIYHSSKSLFHKNNSYYKIKLLYEDNSGHNDICKIYDTSGLAQCLEYFNNRSYIQCNHDSIKKEDDDNGGTNKVVLDPELFSQKGLLLADTKFNHQYDFYALLPNYENRRT